MTGPGKRPHPRETIREACQGWGEAEVVRRCVDILDGAPLGDEELGLLGYLAATPSRRAPRGGAWPAWYPVWALRCLRYVWRPEAAAAVMATSGHPWRVREMAAKVCLIRELGEAAENLAGLLDDPYPGSGWRPRVRSRRWARPSTPKGCAGCWPTPNLGAGPPPGWHCDACRSDSTATCRTRARPELPDGACAAMVMDLWRA